MDADVLPAPTRSILLGHADGKVNKMCLISPIRREPSGKKKNKTKKQSQWCGERGKYSEERPRNRRRYHHHASLCQAEFLSK